MLKLAFSTLLVIGALSAVPAYADSKQPTGTERGCTLDPFNHTTRCVDFDHCTTDKNGNKVCPVVVIKRKAAAY